MAVHKKSPLLIIGISLCLFALGLYQFSPQRTNKQSLALVDKALANKPINAQKVDPRFTVPDGFVVSVYAQNLGKARMLHMTSYGDLLLTQPRAGVVTLLTRDSNGDGQPDDKAVLLKGLTRPHGIELVNGWLYIAESNQIGRVKFNERKGEVEGAYEVLITGLADSGSHWTKTLRAGEDGWMYFSSGSTCNVCEEGDDIRAAISRFRLNEVEPSLTVFATGLRNSVGMDWSPWEQALYATDNGRDWLGDAYPPCELNKITPQGFYGWPYINGFADLDPDYGKGKDALLKTAISPVHGFRAHNAPLGIRFIRGETLPTQYHRSALVALHGSWNRSSKDGYKVVSLHWQSDGSIIEQDFMTGFLRKGDTEQVIGRPVDVAEDVNGALYISDDYAGVIYKVSYLGTQANVTLNVTPDEQQAIQLGETIFAQYRCGSCHNPSMGKRGRVVKELNALAEKYTQDELAAFLESPTPPMPLYPFNEQQRLALAQYLIDRY